MRLQDVHKADLSFFVRLKFLIFGEKYISTLLKNERHKYFKSGRQLQIKRVVEAANMSALRLNKYTVRTSLSEVRGNSGFGLEVGSSFYVDDYLNR